jgi:uncharacterized membrane protein YoaK (UPF0700 family)
VAADRLHGPLPALLVCLTVVTGLVDAFSYLSLGHVFVANMTGNEVFLGFALAGVGEISIVASLLAMLAFVLDATMGGRWAAERAVHRGTYWVTLRRFRPASFWPLHSSQALSAIETRRCD